MITYRIISTLTILLLTGCGQGLCRVGGCHGILDPFFATSGKATIEVLTSANLKAIAIQPDSKIVAVGYANNGTQNVVVVVRLASDGTLDSTFGTSGVVTTAVGASDDRGIAVALQADGSIVVAGQTLNGAADFDFFVARYTSAGALDATFGTAGITSTDLNTNSQDYLYSLKLDASEKPILIGNSDTAGNTSTAIVRYTTAGVLDATFNATGILLSTFTGTLNLANALTLEPGGNLVIAGYSGTLGAEDSLIARFDTTGAADVTFNTTGNNVVTIDPGTDQIWDLARLSDGSFLAIGEYPSGSTTQTFFTKFLTGGTTDSTFGTSGTLLHTLGLGSRMRRMAVDTSGRIVAVGDAYNGTSNDIGVYRFLDSGALDTRFGSSGGFTINFSSGTHTGSAVALQADGKIVIGATVPSTNTGTAFGIAQVVP